MIEEILGPDHGRAGRASRSGKAKTDEPQSAAKTAGGDKASEVVVSSELTELIDRVKGAENFRKERVHQVLEKLQRGELVTSETGREAAEKILREGL